MRKLFKSFFSRITIGILLMLLQLFMMAMSILRIYENFLYCDIFLKLLSLVVVIVIINKNSNPSYKLAWVVPILVFPMFGGLLYLFVSGQMHTKRFFQNLSKLEKEINSEYPQNSDTIASLSEKYPHRKNSANFINKVSGGCVYTNEFSQYFPLGEDKFHSVLEELKKAEAEKKETEVEGEDESCE